MGRITRYKSPLVLAGAGAGELQSDLKIGSIAGKIAHNAAPSSYLYCVKLKSFLCEKGAICKPFSPVISLIIAVCFCFLRIPNIFHL